MKTTARRILKGGIAALVTLTALSQNGFAQLALGTATGTYNQNFDTLITTGTAQPWANNTTLEGWYLFNSVSAPITTYSAGAGASNSGTFNSFGTGTATDRSLGGTGSGGTYFGSPATGLIAGWMAVAFTNSTLGNFNSFTLDFNGEQWRNGGNASAQTMVLEYGFGPTFNDVSWTAPGDTFDWASPVVGTTAAAVDGNVAGLVTGKGGTVSGLEWEAGSTLWIRWVERNDTGNDHGLGIDDLSLDWTTGAPNINYWDTNGATAGTGGNGSWTAVSTNWNTLADGTGAVQPLAVGAKAVFSGTAGTVTIGANAVADGQISFRSTGFVLSGGTLALGNSRIEVLNDTDTATISATLSGSVGLTKVGAGTLVLSGSNTYTGKTTVSIGTLQIATDAALGATTNELALNGGTLKTVSTMDLNADRPVTGAGSIDVAPGTSLTLNGTVTAGAIGITNTGTLIFSGSVPAVGGLTFSKSGTVSNTAGKLVITGGITTTHPDGTAIINNGVDFGNAGRTITVARGTAAVDLRFTGSLENQNTVSGGNPVATYISKLGAGVLEFAGDNSGIQGGLSIGSTAANGAPGGTVIIHNEFGLGTSQLRFNGGILNNASAGKLDFFSIGISLAAGQAPDFGATFSGQPFEFFGPVALFALSGATFQHRIVANTNVTFSGGLQGVPTTGTPGVSTGLTIAGTGRVFLTETNPIPVPLTVEGGRLYVSSNFSAAVKPAIFVNNSGELGGDQSSGQSLGDVTVQSSGVLAPGRPTDITGTLFVQNLSLQEQAIYRVDIGGTGAGDFDQVNVVGGVTLGGALSIDLATGYFPAQGETFVIVNNDLTDPVSGLFAGLAEGQHFAADGWAFRINYGAGTDGNDVVLTSVPEPGSAALLLGGLGLLSLRRRRKG